ncbi:MAG: phosphopantetheine-binding protein [Candidatus Adiutrix sp.]|jgi:acyl carrier protein|nr:phosphopantetheine-binding protein [Candidatus Adiutrix sp.]
MDLKSELKKYLVEDLHLEDLSPEEIEDAAPLFGEGLGLDSLDAVELVVLLQKRFSVLIKDMEEAREAFGSVDRLAAFIAERRAQA